MWTRSDLKLKGKGDFKRNYWACFTVSLFFCILQGAAFSGSAFSNQDTLSSISPDEWGQFLNSGDILALLPLFLIGLGITYIYCFFFENPLSVGISKFFINNQTNRGDIKDILFIFKNRRYLNSVLTMFLRDLFILLWSLLLFVPGIIKSYEYLMIPYLLAENPEMSRKEAFTRSKAMMQGNKWKTFVLDFSFLPWLIGGVFTLGLLNIFYVFPYMLATRSELYKTLNSLV